MENKGKKRGKSSTLLTGSSLVLTQMMVNGLSSQNVSADLWDWFNPFKYAWFAAMWNAIFGSDSGEDLHKNDNNSRISEKKAVSNGDKDVREKERNGNKNEAPGRYFEEAAKILKDNYPNFYEKGGYGAGGILYSGEIELLNDRSFHFVSSIVYNPEAEEDKRYSFFGFCKKIYFKSEQELLESVKKHVEIRKKLEKVFFEKVKSIKDTGRYSYSSHGNTLSLANEELAFYDDKGRAVKKIRLVPKDLKVELYYSSDVEERSEEFVLSSGEDIDRLSGILQAVLENINKYDEECITCAKQGLEEVFGENNVSLKKDGDNLCGHIKIKNYCLDVKICKGHSGSEVWICGKNLGSFSLDLNTFKQKVSEFKEIFEKYLTKFKECSEKGYFKFSFDEKECELILTSTDEFGVLVSPEIFGEEGTRNKVEKIRKVIFDPISSMYCYEYTGKENDESSSRGFSTAFDEGLGSNAEKGKNDEHFWRFLEHLANGGKQAVEIEEHNIAENCFEHYTKCGF